MPVWLSYFLGALIAALVAIFLAPLVPEPGGQICSIIAWVVCAILIVLGLLALVRSPRI